MSYLPSKQGGLTDGDKGDVTVSGNGTVIKFSPDKVTPIETITELQGIITNQDQIIKLLISQLNSNGQININQLTDYLTK